MSIWPTFESAAISFAFSILFAILTWLASARASLIWGVPHIFYHRINGPEGEVGVSTATVSVSNPGRARATELEVVFNWYVPDVSVWPQRAYSITTNPEGRMCIHIKDLGPREYIQIHMLDVQRNLPDVLTVRCAEAQGKQVNIVPMRLYSNWFNIALVSLMFVGFFAIVLLVVSILRSLAAASGFG